MTYDAKPRHRLSALATEGKDGGQHHRRGRLPRERWLARYAECFDTVELNATFYGLPSREAVQRWREQVPTDFLFAAKMSRYGTHLRRLREPADWLQRFLDVLEPLGPQLGPILVQLPPRWDRDVGRLAAFLDGEYGYKDLYMGVPVVLGSDGIERIVELDLDDAEQQALQASADAVREVVGVLTTTH